MWERMGDSYQSLRLFGVKWLQSHWGQEKNTLVSYITRSLSQIIGRDGPSLWHPLLCVNIKTKLEGEQRGRRLITRGLWDPDGWAECKENLHSVTVAAALAILLLTAHSRYSPSLGHIDHRGGPFNFPPAPTCPCKTHLVIFNYWQQQEHIVECDFLSFHLLIQFKNKFMIYGLY